MLEILGLVAIVGVVYFTYKTIDESINKDLEIKSGSAPAAPVLTQPTPCGCGRSKSGFCVGLHSLSEEEWSTHPDNTAVTPKKRSRKKSEQQSD